MTVQMPAPHGRLPESDDGLTLAPVVLPPEVARAAQRAFYDAGGEGSCEDPFIAAMLAAVVTDRGLRDTARILNRPT